MYRLYIYFDATCNELDEKKIIEYYLHRIISRSTIQTASKYGVKKLKTAGYNDARTVIVDNYYFRYAFIILILKPPGNEKGCACSDCEAACKIPEFPDECQKFVIVPGVDGVTFIMVVVFVLGSIIFMAIIFGHSVMKNSVLKCEFFSQFVFA